jgi:hypothetical protein
VFFLVYSSVLWHRLIICPAILILVITVLVYVIQFGRRFIEADPVHGVNVGLSNPTFAFIVDYCICPLNGIRNERLQRIR